MQYELIHVNLSLAKYQLFSEEMKSFWALEKPIYDVAKTYSGFIRDIEFPDRFSVFPEPHIFNATVWKNIEDLREFVYTGMHAGAMKDRKNWFAETSLPKYTLFWVRSGAEVTEALASKRLLMYSDKGPSAEAFDFKCVYNEQGIRL